MDAYGIGKAHVLGFSDGGNIAMIFAMKYPDRVLRLILNGANLDAKGVKPSIQIPIEIGYRFAKVFAKKSETANSTDNKYVSQAYSFTHKQMNKVFVSKPYLHPTDRVLIVDDFLADGQASHALIDLVHQAGGEVVGIGIAVEKGQQNGGRWLREEGYRLESIAIIEEMNYEAQTIRFRDQE